MTIILFVVGVLLAVGLTGTGVLLVRTVRDHRRLEDDYAVALCDLLDAVLRVGDLERANQATHDRGQAEVDEAHGLLETVIAENLRLTEQAACVLPPAPVRTHDAAFLQSVADGGSVHRELVTTDG